jgi:hypothetical protein
MLFPRQWSNKAAAIGTAGALIGLISYSAPAGAAVAARTERAAGSAQSGGVSPHAALGTPQLNKVGKGKAGQEIVRQLVQCGGTMYAVGGFTSISQGSTNYTRNNILSFSAAAPYTITSWAPDVNGQVNSIAFNGTNCSDAYIGGDFTSVNGTAVRNIAEISTATGNVVAGFGTHANFEVWTIVPVNGRLLVGGDFRYINGSKDAYLASLSPVTGKSDGFVNLNISGDYKYCAPKGFKGGCTSKHSHTEVYNQQLSHSGTLDLVEGHFTSVGGLPRQQIFMLNLAGTKATVTGWTSAEWDGSDPSAYPYYQCYPDEAFYIRSAAWSPSDSTVYTAATGFHPVNQNAAGARDGLCDSVAAWPATQTSVTDTWVEYSGCYSYYSVGADNAAVYAAGHPRYADNPGDCKAAGPGAVPDPGLQGLNPGTGTVELNKSGTAKYTMSRDNGNHMLITSAGLWISSTNRYTVNKCGDLKGPAGHNAAGHAGICLLPYPS